MFFNRSIPPFAARSRPASACPDTGVSFGRILALMLALCQMSTSLAQPEPRAFSLPRTQIVEISDPVGERDYRLFIQTPVDYEESTEQEFPIIYITDATYNLPMIEGFVRVASNSDAIEQVILVGVSSERGRTFRESRILDYTPVVDDEWLSPTGGADAFLDFVRSAVFGYVETNYRADGDNRTYVGYSLGGLLGAYALLAHPEMFRNYVLVSPSLYYRDNYVLKTLESGEVSLPGSLTRVYLSAGEYETPEHSDIRNDLVADAERFSERLNGINHPMLEVRMQVVEDAVHSTAFPEPMARALHWMLKTDASR